MSASRSWRRGEARARGSYSYAPPGHAGDRAVLSAPVADRLFLAGEASSPNFFSTAHGAWISDLAAAEAEAGLTSLGHSRLVAGGTIR
ncbi:MAG: FAD-dependent oxidoreductase [Stellaceae bacterium]